MRPTESAKAAEPPRPQGTQTFSALLVSQTFSLLGSGMTGFALVIWAFEQTGEATTLALAAFFRFAPTVLVTPFAGALVDRWNRKLTIMISDLATGATTVALLILFSGGSLAIWQWYIAGAIAGAFESFHFPAFSAAITMLLPKSQYGRASGLLSLAQSASGIFAPVAAAALLVPIGLAGIMWIDIGTFVVATAILLSITIPSPPVSEVGRKARTGILRESVYGFRFIRARRSLLGLQLVFFMSNLVFTFGFTVSAPMILKRTGEDALILGAVLSVAAVGGVIGSLVMSAWGGPHRKVHGVLAGMAVSGVTGEILLGVGQEFIIWSIASFSSAFLIPIINGSNQAIWQAKVPPDVQGKVFAARRLIAQVTVPIALLLAGPLADRVFEPAMAPGGSLADNFGWLVGTGPGAGMALMIVIFGVIGTAVGLAGYAFRAVRDAEVLLPDYDASTPAA